MLAGTIAVGVLPDGEERRACGWGPSFLDGGCGFDIGQWPSVRDPAPISQSVEWPCVFIRSYADARLLMAVRMAADHRCFVCTAWTAFFLIVSPRDWRLT